MELKGFQFYLLKKLGHQFFEFGGSQNFVSADDEMKMDSIGQNEKAFLSIFLSFESSQKVIELSSM